MKKLLLLVSIIGHMGYLYSDVTPDDNAFTSSDEQLEKKKQCEKILKRSKAAFTAGVATSWLYTPIAACWYMHHLRLQKQYATCMKEYKKLK